MKQKRVKLLSLLLILIIAIVIIGCSKNVIYENRCEVNLDEILDYKNSEFKDKSKINEIANGLPGNMYLKEVSIIDNNKELEDENLNIVELVYSNFDMIEINFEDESFIEVNDLKVMETNAIILFSLIEELDTVKVVMGEEKSIVFVRDVLINSFENEYKKELSDITESKEILEEFIKR